MTFEGFSREGTKFLEDLMRNNSKEWFEANRDRYEKYILSPNKAYVEEMGEHLQILVPTINAIPKVNHSLFRIYRDARLHPEEPIKERIGIILWQGSEHRMQSSSFYMHYDSKEIFVAAGIRNFKPPLLKAYREYIQNDSKREELHQILTELRDKGYQIPETKFKRMPRNCDIDGKYDYLCMMGSTFSYTTFVIDETFYSEDIIYRNFDIYRDMLKLQQWVYELTLYAN